jgi:uncharacterized membrane protein
MNTSRHKVKPRHYTQPPPYAPPDIPRVTDDERSKATHIAAGGNYGCGAFIVGGIVLIGGIYTIGVIPAVIATFALPFAYFFIRRSTEISRLAGSRIQAERDRIQSQQTAHEVAARSQQAEIEGEALRLTETLTSLHEAVPTHVQNLARLLRSAESDLDAAERDFADSAFAPFWDSIEHAAGNLSSFDETTRLLASQATQYYNSLRDRDHTFPRFPVDLTTLPDQPIPPTGCKPSFGERNATSSSRRYTSNEKPTTSSSTVSCR